MLALGSNARGRSGLLSILRPQDVFATSLYTGNGGTQTIIDGFDPDLVWGKARAGQYAGDSSFGRHVLVDRVRGAGRDLATNLTDAEQTASNAVSFTASGGHVVGGATKINDPNTTFVNWAFRQADKFFKIVTYTGDGTSGRQIPHNLGVAPGMIIFKRLDSAQHWPVWHRSLTADSVLYLNLTSSGGSATPKFGSPYVAPTASGFTVGNSGETNLSGGTYVAYLFAHDPDPNGIIQCGSFTSSGSNGAVTLGWQPQFVLVKCSGSASDWWLFDAARGMNSPSDKVLYPNLSTSEINNFGAMSVTSTGFNLSFLNSNQPYVYLAIRAPTT